MRRNTSARTVHGDHCLRGHQPLRLTGRQQVAADIAVECHDLTAGAKVNLKARLAWPSLASLMASRPASETSQMLSNEKLAGFGSPGICDLLLPWIVVVSIKSKSPPDDVMLVAVVIEVPKVILLAVPLLNVSNSVVSTPPG